MTCQICGFDVGAPSLGGPGICAWCDCDGTGVGRLRREAGRADRTGDDVYRACNRDSVSHVEEDMRRQIAHVAEDHPQGVVSMWKVKAWADALATGPKMGNPSVSLPASLPALDESLLRRLHAMTREELLDWLSASYKQPPASLPASEAPIRCRKCDQEVPDHGDLACVDCLAAAEAERDRLTAELEKLKGNG